MHNVVVDFVEEHSHFEREDVVHGWLLVHGWESALASVMACTSAVVADNVCRSVGISWGRRIAAVIRSSTLV
jgi:hypothetical protein